MAPQDDLTAAAVTFQWVEPWEHPSWKRVHRRCLNYEVFDDGTRIEEYMAKDGHSVWRLVDESTSSTLIWLWMPEMELWELRSGHD